MSEYIKIFLVAAAGGAIIYTLHYLLSVSEKDAEQMGIITPRMSRDPKVQERLDRETPLGIKRKLEEAAQASKISEMADKEVGPDGVVRKKN